MVKAEDIQPPATTYPPAAQWATAQIPIDPALQQQGSTTSTPYPHYQYAHYPAYAATGQYPQYAPPQPPQAPTTVAPAPAPAVAVAGSSGGKQDNNDVDALKDALGSAGVDLRAEEETLHRTHDQPQAYRQFEDRTRKQPQKPSFHTGFIGITMRTIAPQHKINKVPEDAVNYLALALRARLQGLITEMSAASAHRADTQFDKPASLYPDGTPMWSIVVRSDVAKQLAVIERIEREEEQRVRRERKEREDAQAAHTAQLAAQSAGVAYADALDEDGQPKKKKKKDGPGVTAKNMSEDVRKKIANSTASLAAGNNAKYSWMTAGGGGGGGSGKAKQSAATATSPTTPGSAATPTSTASSWARPYVSATKPAAAAAASVEPEDSRRPITLRDAMFVIERERGHGGGRGSAQGWT